MGMLRALFAGKSQVMPPRRLEGELVDVEIVGESGYQDYLRQLRRRRGDLEIVLRPEPTNPYDPNAVVVLIDNQPVGYLPRASAREWQPMLLAAEAEGFIVAGAGRDPRRD
jgi:hypothetical protein